MMQSLVSFTTFVSTFIWCFIIIVHGDFDPFISLSQLLWEGGSDSVSAYRIPVTTQCYDGSIVAFSEARKLNAGDGGPKFIAFRKSKNGGKTWSTTKFIVDSWTHPDGLNLGAVMVDEEVNELILLYTTCAHFECVDRNTTVRHFLMRSNDCGEIWSEPVDLSQANHDFFNWSWTAGPGYGIQKKHHPHKGRLVVCGHTISGPMGLFCIYSDDHGHTWKIGAKLPGIPWGGPLKAGDFAPTENQVVELPDGNLYIDARNEYKYKCACRMYFNSTDGGETIPLETVRFNTVAVDPTCDGSILLHNDVLYMSHAFNNVTRINTTLRWSLDYGQSWSDSLNINTGNSGYSCLTPVDDNHIGLIYENGIGPLWFVKIQLHR